MIKWLCVALLLSALAQADVQAADYLLTVEHMGFRDVPIAVDKSPKDQLISKLECLITPGQRFVAKTKTGNKTLYLNGRIEEGSDGVFNWKYLVFATQTEISIGRYGFSASTGGAVTVGKRTLISGSERGVNVLVDENKPGEVLQSRNSVYVTLEIYKPIENPFSTSRHGLPQVEGYEE